MLSIQARRAGIMATYLVLMGGLVASLASCSAGQPTAISPSHARTAGVPGRTKARTTAPTHSAPTVKHVTGTRSPLPVPAALRPFGRAAFTGVGTWHPSGRRVDGVPAIYETTLVPPGGGPRAGVAWMDTRLLSARLYSGSKSPGGGPYRYTAPIEPAQAASLVAAFNGGFKMSDAHGGY